MRFLREALRISGLRRSSGVIDRMIARWRLIMLVVDIGRRHLLLDLAHAGQHAHDAAEAADLLDLRQLIGQIVKIELALAHLVGDALRLFGIDRLRRLFDQRDDVAHAENAVGDALGMKILQRIHLFAGADQFDRLAGDGAHRQGRAAAPVAVDAGQHDAGNADALIESSWRD